MSKPKPKIFLTGMVYNEFDHMKELLETHSPYIDGVSFVDHFSNDGTYELLRDYAGDGKVIRMNWFNRHDIPLTAATHLCASATRGDWMIYADASLRYPEPFLKKLSENIDIWESNGIGSVWWDRPFVFKYHPFLFYMGSPHCGLQGVSHTGKNLILRDDDNVRREGTVLYLADFMINKKDLLKNGFLNPIRYYFCYDYSNECVLMYAHFGENIFKEHEGDRTALRYYFENTLKKSCTFGSLEAVFRDETLRKNPQFVYFVEKEFRLKDFFRIKVLEEPLDDIIANRYDWSYKHYLKTGEIKQDPKETEYIGLITQYEMQLGGDRS